MTMKHIAIYRARMNGNSVEEEREILEDRKRRSNKNLFKPTSYEKYLWQKENKKLGGNGNER